MQLLGGLTPDVFLREYWQKKPLLIRQAWPDFSPVITKEELAGLSLEQDIESRLIIEQQAQPNYQTSQAPWELKTGPFSEQTYQQLPESHWTLLIQALDHWLPEAANILQRFNFIPNWRVDDLMVSYAVDGGSVGAHYDQYDVFLLQAEGQREWHIGEFCNDKSEIIEGLPIKLLLNFNETDRWILEPGDMLYLPPALSHYGIACGQCMTYSIGFRAPSHSEIAQTLLDNIIIESSDDLRYQDRQFSRIDKPGQITQAALEPIKDLLKTLIDDEHLLARALGELMSEAKYPQLTAEALNHEDVVDALQYIQDTPDQWCIKDEKTRLAYYHKDQTLSLFIQGKQHLQPIENLALVEYLANHHQYEHSKLCALIKNSAAQEMIEYLIKHQHLYWP